MADHYFGISDIGKKRSNNEDSFIAEMTVDAKFTIACVIDGVGGYEGGEVAAQITHDAILQQLKQPFSNPIDAIKQSLRVSNTDIFNEKNSSGVNPKMACVVSFALVDVPNNQFYYGHVGDTRLYLLRDHSLVKISHDHSFVGFLEDGGKLSEYEAMHHPKRNEINRALGFATDINADEYIETGQSPFLPRDMLLLCTDGLTDLVDNATMTSILTTEKDLQAKATALIKAANDAGGKDNITVVLVQNFNQPQHGESIKPNPTSLYKENLEKNENGKMPLSASSTKASSSGKKSSGIGSFVRLLFALIIITLAWIIYRYYHNKNQHQQEPQEISVRVRNPQEAILRDSIAHTTSGEVFVLNQAGSTPVTITDSIVVNNDTLRILGNGVTLVADTFYKGAAFILSPKCKHIELDSMTLQNFDVGIIASNKGLILRNVQFKNCRVPVQYQFLFKENELINERIGDTGIIVK